MLDVLVYGSCVSRDLVAIHKKSLNCVDYVARQSIISAASDGIDIDLNSQLKSKFQNEMLFGDFASDAFVKILARLETSDLLLLDIIDDRFGVYSLMGSYITPSAEFSQAGIRKELALGDHIPFGSDVHFELWAESVIELKVTLADNLKKVFVLGAPFTDVSLDGSSVPNALSKEPSIWNHEYERYYRLLANLGFNVIMLPRKMAVTTRYHQWGVAPFHYVEGAYRWWLDQIMTFRQAQHD